MTVITRSEDNGIKVKNREEAMRIAEETIDNNPHYKLSFLTAKEFLKEMIDGTKDIYAFGMTDYDIEVATNKQSEEYNMKKWTFNKGVEYCPYWNWTKEQYDNYGQMMLELELRILGRI